MICRCAFIDDAWRGTTRKYTALRSLEYRRDKMLQRSLRVQHDVHVLGPGRRRRFHEDGHQLYGSSIRTVSWYLRI